MEFTLLIKLIWGWGRSCVLYLLKLMFALTLNVIPPLFVFFFAKQEMWFLFYLMGGIVSLGVFSFIFSGQGGFRDVTGLLVCLGVAIYYIPFPQSIICGACAFELGMVFIAVICFLFSLVCNLFRWILR